MNKLYNNNSIDLDEEKYKSPKTFVIKEHYNINALRDLYEKNKKLNDNGEYVLQIKDYETLCEIIEAKMISQKDTRSSQNKDFKRFFSFSRNGKYYLIDMIYDIPLPKGFYNNPIDILSQYLICNLIENCPNKTLICSINKLAYRLGYVNDLFFPTKNHINKFTYDTFSDSKRSKIQYFNNINITEKFFNDTPKKYKYRIQKALDTLEDKSLIFVKNILYGEFGDFNLDTISTINNLDEFGDPLPTTYTIQKNSNFRILSDQETELYLKYQRELLLKYNCNSLSELYKLSFSDKGLILFNSFFDEFHSIIKEKLGFDAIYPSLQIIFTQEYVQQENQKLFSQLQTMNMINQAFGNKLIQNKENELNRKLNYLENNSESFSSKELNEQKKYYINTFKKEKKLIENLIFRDK